MFHSKGTFVCHISELSKRFGSAAKTIHLNGRVVEFKQVPSKKTGKKQGFVVGEYQVGSTRKPWTCSYSKALLLRSNDPDTLGNRGCVLDVMEDWTRSSGKLTPGC